MDDVPTEDGKRGRQISGNKKIRVGTTYTLWVERSMLDLFYTKEAIHTAWRWRGREISLIIGTITGLERDNIQPGDGEDDISEITNQDTNDIQAGSAKDD